MDSSSNNPKEGGNSPRRRIGEVRRLGRGWALCLLYTLEFDQEIQDQMDRFTGLVDRAVQQNEAFSFARELAAGTAEHMARLDHLIQGSSPRWKVRRMDIIDRNILRLASYELFHRPDIPPRVVINEAVELAKRFGSTSTRSFVNGILQQICIDNEIALKD